MCIRDRVYTVAPWDSNNFTEARPMPEAPADIIIFLFLRELFSIKKYIIGFGRN